jgi:hypothetical protein
MSDSFVGMTRNQPLEHLTLPIGEGRQTASDPRFQRLTLAVGRVGAKSRAHSTKQHLVIEWLLDEIQSGRNT